MLADLETVFPALDVFDRVVAENGAVVWTPATKRMEVMGEPPPPAFLDALRARGVEPLSAGRVVVATSEPHEKTVLDVVRSLDLKLHLEFNKGAVMVLPQGITKRAGLAVALDQTRISPDNVVAVGDAENDHALLAMCGFRIAVANAVPRLAENADWVTPSADGAGVVELVDRLLADDP
jgi:hydroxymethylpyrimidine pyrophosphatase-like HAD family hydrolase